MSAGDSDIADMAAIRRAASSSRKPPANASKTLVSQFWQKLFVIWAFTSLDFWSSLVTCPVGGLPARPCTPRSQWWPPSGEWSGFCPNRCQFEDRRRFSSTNHSIHRKNVTKRWSRIQMKYILQTKGRHLIRKKLFFLALPNVPLLNFDWRSRNVRKQSQWPMLWC